MDGARLCIAASPPSPKRPHFTKCHEAELLLNQILRPAISQPKCRNCRRSLLFVFILDDMLSIKPNPHCALLTFAEV
jgi:hypothetical protein